MFLLTVLIIRAALVLDPPGKRPLINRPFYITDIILYYPQSLHPVTLKQVLFFFFLQIRVPFIILLTGTGLQ